MGYGIGLAILFGVIFVGAGLFWIGSEKNG